MEAKPRHRLPVLHLVHPQTKKFNQVMKRVRGLLSTNLQTTAWLEQIDIVAMQSGTPIATCDAKLIRRDQITSRFWSEMAEPKKETSCLAFELFDRYGRLKRQYYEHSFKRGSGVWGHELDGDDILLIENIGVKVKERRRGIGRRLVQAALGGIVPKTSRFVALARPGILALDVEYTDEYSTAESQARSERFFRSLGLRRVGNSRWFAFVDDSDHPSRQLKAAEDWDEPADAHGPDSIFGTAPEAYLSIIDPESSGNEGVRKLHDSMPADAQHASWSAVDGQDDNWLHLAATHFKLEAVQYILSRRPDLATKRNRVGDTPLEALQAEMELMRARGFYPGRTVPGSDEFAGFEQSTIACIAALSGSEVFNLDELSPEDLNEICLATEEDARQNPKAELVGYTLRLRYGCTCGECIGGFLSPRMLHALLCSAEVQYDIMMDSFHQSPNGPDWVEYNGEQVKFLPDPVLENLKTNKSMREGFISTCGHIGACLNQKRIPNERNVLYIHQNETSQWPPVTRNYLQRGGTVAAVALMIFEHAMEQDEYTGDGNHQAAFEDEIEKLPECRNDHEFEFASTLCGYKAIAAEDEYYIDIFGNPVSRR
ncbi:hypothetical protein NQ176_g3198 [Zarea fungicola]|uniref:Uncharacterized protein n=1 Tax=Zarea fungicola TaxID=93591 RepID=A0ACC1NM83_9HYPO|nr:hypothetical protein NQ176_g3198 [Lecanicillium fungicola]